jgi:hypothetical protein
MLERHAVALDFSGPGFHVARPGYMCQREWIAPKPTGWRA